MISVDEIEQILPQTQCGECGFKGCRPYAEALVQGHAPIDRCPPGGVETVQLLGTALSVNPEPYLQHVRENTRPPALATIREAECVGCTKCIQACPVDAIIGSAKVMHAIINHECTGCGLCVEPCPVDCIDIVEVPQALYNKNEAHSRYHAKQIRILREEHEKQQAYREKKKLAVATHKVDDKAAKQAFILQALARSQNKRHE
ncbi:electron transport complex protein (plasmid) [Legionella adelaidensis]|uniref:Electron transport complex protein n=1 Tax=Legionella adelaidensis TaxID=45056 RepID=A0A0W0R197_9GAMM|nr:RnfABCDGE type electron transport complex subunit B [Legionella adelaidensis]KTC64839.1 electron transport complex protein [Legionella adelaidensis]VEH82990.1 electron transport complex protein [Legionella adelaidensis]